MVKFKCLLLCWFLLGTLSLELLSTLMPAMSFYFNVTALVCYLFFSSSHCYYLVICAYESTEIWSMFSGDPIALNSACDAFYSLKPELLTQFVFNF